jgi:hypothetical protein
MDQFPKFTPAWNSTCFGQFLRPSSGVYSPYTRHWYMSYRFEDSFRAGPGWNLLRHVILHVSGSSSVHHQEFIHRTLGTGICHTGLKTVFEQDQGGTYSGMKFYMFRAVPLPIIRSLFTVHSALVYVIQFGRQLSSRNRMEFHPGPARKLSSNLHDMYQCRMYSEQTPDEGQRNCPKNVEFHAGVN